MLLLTVLARRVARVDRRRRARRLLLLLHAHPIIAHLRDRTRRVIAIRDPPNADEAARFVLVLVEVAWRQDARLLLVRLHGVLLLLLLLWWISRVVDRLVSRSWTWTLGWLLLHRGISARLLRGLLQLLLLQVLLLLVAPDQQESDKTDQGDSANTSDDTANDGAYVS